MSRKRDNELRQWWSVDALDAGHIQEAKSLVMFCSKGEWRGVGNGNCFQAGL